MSKFKGSKGVWEINPRASRNVRCGNLTIANCSSGQNGDNEEEEFANAKLIASAPEMLEMLEKCKKSFDNLNQPFISSDIQQLIKKATEI